MLRVTALLFCALILDFDLFSRPVGLGASSAVLLALSRLFFIRRPSAATMMLPQMHAAEGEIIEAH